MKIKSITIRKREAYELRAGAEEFKAEICLEGGSQYPADIKIGIPNEALEPIVGIIAQATAMAMSGAAKDFHSEVKAMLSGPTIDALPESAA